MKKILERLCPLALAGWLTIACGNPASVTSAQNARPREATNAPGMASKSPSAGAEPGRQADQTTIRVTAGNVVGATRIELKGRSVAVSGSGAIADGGKVTINSAGVFEARGTLSDGQIVVDTKDKQEVRLILNGVEIANSRGSAIEIADAKEVAIILADGSANKISDAASYAFKTAETNEPNAAIFSRADLAIAGNGSLEVRGNFNDGIASKDGLTISAGTIIVDAKDDGIRGKDSLVVQSGTLNIKSGGDGLKSDNNEDPKLGYVSILNGTVEIDSGGDAIQAQTEVRIRNGHFNLNSGGGSNGRVRDTRSAKAIKGAAGVFIDGGTFTINAADDAINSNARLIVNAGILTLATGDDGMHADGNLEINGGTIDITKSYEGIEGSTIAINGGNIRIAAADDGINIAGDDEGMGMRWRGRSPVEPDVFSGKISDRKLAIAGGYLYVNANGDGIDIGGPIVMTGGLVIVNGPTMRNNGALDHAGFTISGGTIVAVGSAGMAQTADQSSTQNALLLNINGTLRAGSLIHISRGDGRDILTFAPAKDIQSLAFSSAELKSGMTYQVSFGGKSTGRESDGFYRGGKYSEGQSYTDFTVSSPVTFVGSGGGFGGRGGGRRR